MSVPFVFLNATLKLDVFLPRGEANATRYTRAPRGLLPAAHGFGTPWRLQRKRILRWTRGGQAGSRCRDAPSFTGHPIWATGGTTVPLRNRSLGQRRRRRQTTTRCGSARGGGTWSRDVKSCWREGRERGVTSRGWQGSGGGSKLPSEELRRPSAHSARTSLSCDEARESHLAAGLHTANAIAQ